MASTSFPNKPAKILCVTPNAAVDRTLIVPALRPGGVMRVTETIVAAGGKGLNVARAVQALGGKAIAAGLLGGYSGRLVAKLAQNEGLVGRWSWMEPESRTCTIVVLREEGQTMAFNEPGPLITTADWQRLVADVAEQAAGADAVCLSGSLPPGCPPDAPGDLIRAVAVTGRPIWVDSSGLALRQAVAARPEGIKVNGEEAGELLGISIEDAVTASRAAARLQQEGIGSVVVTLAEDGAVLAGGEGRWWVQPPPVTVVSTVGSGDSFLAGLVTAQLAGLPPNEALRRAVAAGTANTLSAGGARFSLDDFNRLLEATTVVVMHMG